MNDVGTTHAFVLSKGFAQVGNHSALIGEDDTRRLFAEVYADPDRPDVRPQEAYKSILSSIQPGWTLRLLQLFWPDPEPRLEFQKQVQRWNTPALPGSVPDAIYPSLPHQGASIGLPVFGTPT